MASKVGPCWQIKIDIYKIGNTTPNDKMCEACIYGKQACLSFNKSKTKDLKRRLFKVHTDVCGPSSILLWRWQKYFVIFVDEYTDYCATYLLACKSADVFVTFWGLSQKGEAHFCLRIVNLWPAYSA